MDDMRPKMVQIGHVSSFLTLAHQFVIVLQLHNRHNFRIYGCGINAFESPDSILYDDEIIGK